MKIKTILTAAALTIITANAGFFDHDKAYYDKHPEEAQSKFKLCEKGIVTALKSGDMALAEKYDKDPECKAARISYKEHRSKIRKAKYEAEHKKREKERAKKQAAFDQAYKEFLAKLQPLKYDAFMAAKKEACDNAPIFGDNLSVQDAKCKAWKDLQKKKENAAIDDAIKQHPGDQLIAYEKNSCTNYSNPNCRIAQIALDKAVNEQKQKYLADIASLKKDFNECQKKFAPLYLHNKFNEASKIENTFKCKTAKEAAMQKFHTFSLLHPIK